MENLEIVYKNYFDIRWFQKAQVYLFHWTGTKFVLWWITQLNVGQAVYGIFMDAIFIIKT